MNITKEQLVALIREEISEAEDWRQKQQKEYEAHWEKNKKDRKAHLAKIYGDEPEEDLGPEGSVARYAKKSRHFTNEELDEAGRPHSMRSGRTMADLDREAGMRETDFSARARAKSAAAQVVSDLELPMGISAGLLDDLTNRILDALEAKKGVMGTGAALDNISRARLEEMINDELINFEGG